MLTKLIFILFMCAFPLAIIAQINIPIVYTNTKDVEFKHDGFTLNWHLDSSKNPDIYTIANHLKTHKIKVITDIDSTIFTVDEGMRFNFILHYKNQENYSTQFYVLPNPIFFNPIVYISFLLLLFSISGLLWVKRKNISGIFLLRFGIISGVGFWLTTFMGGLLHGNYSHAKMGVSELGTIGTPSEYFMSFATMLLAITGFLFSIGFVLASRQLSITMIPAVLSFTMALSMAWAAIFPSGNIYHGVLGPLPLGILMGCLVAAIFWKKTATFRSIRLLSLICFCIMILFVLRFIPYLQQNYEGFIQRTLWLGWSIWFMGLSYYLPKLLLYDKRIN